MSSQACEVPTSHPSRSLLSLRWSSASPYRSLCRAPCTSCLLGVWRFRHLRHCAPTSLPGYFPGLCLLDLLRVCLRDISPRPASATALYDVYLFTAASRTQLRQLSESTSIRTRPLTMETVEKKMKRSWA